VSDGFERTATGPLEASQNIPTRKLAGMFSSAFSPYCEILKLVWPLALGMVNNAVMQFVDRAYLAQDSMSALEAVLPATTLAWVFMSFFQSVVGYTGVFVAQYHGQGETGKCAACHRAGLLLALLSGGAMLPLVPLGNWLFAVTSATEALVSLERSYYSIVCCGGVFLFGQMASLSYFTGRGKTRIVFWVNLAGNLLNIALDPVLIFGWDALGIPRLGLAGAAYATVFAQAVQFGVLYGAVRRDIAAERAGTAFAAHAVRQLVLQVLRFGVPAGGYEILNMLSFTIFVFVTGRLGDVAFAASNACFTVNYLLFAPMMGFSLGAQTLVGQHLGRRDPDGAARALRRTLVLGLSFVAVSAALVWALNGPILGLFAPDEAGPRAEFFGLGRTLLLLMSAWLLLDGADVILSGALKGAGDTRFVFWWMLVCSFVIWMPLVFLALGLGGTMPVLWSTMIVYVIIIASGAFWRWRGGRWRSIKLV